MARIALLAGKKFGRLHVICDSGKRANSKVYWLVVCECGRTKLVCSGHLTSSHTVSCGCANRERVIAQNTKHGHAKRGARSGTYQSWVGMLSRCLNHNHKNWPEYGGRGITVCARWRESFADFLADMGERPKGKTLDRIEVNGNYEPGNCRWATVEEQIANRRPYSNAARPSGCEPIAEGAAW